MKPLPHEIIEVHSSRLSEIVLPKLKGRVFHVTDLHGFNGIFSTGYIVSNQDNRFPFRYGQSENSYGRKRGYICLFDLRKVTEVQLEDALMKYYFLNPHFAEDHAFFLYLNDSLYPDLIPCNVAEKEEVYSEMWIPNVEAWYKGTISVEALDGILEVKVEPAKLGPWSEAVVRAWKLRE